MSNQQCCDAQNMPLRVIVDNVVRQLHHNGSPVSKELAEYLVNSVTVRCGGSVPPSDIAQIIAECQIKLVANPVEIAVVKLQIYVDNHIPDRETFLAVVKEDQDVATYPLLQEILTADGRSTWDLDQLHKKIVSYVVERFGMGNAKDPNILRDCSAALSSVWSEGALTKFAMLSPSQRKAELQDYLLLSSGVRLFNRETLRGGVGITNLPEAVKTTLERFSAALDSEIENVEQGKDALTNLIFAVLMGKFQEYEDNVESLKDALILIYQYLASIAGLKTHVAESKTILAQAQHSYYCQIKELQEDCRNERVVAADVVFPRFLTLAKSWSIFQNEEKRVAFLQRAFDQIQDHMKIWKEMNEQLTEAMEKNKSEPQVLAAKVSPASLQNPNFRLLTKETIPKYDKIPVSLQGTCIVTLVEHAGLVVTGNRDVGILQFGNNNFVFRNGEAAVRFSEDPQKYLEGLSHCVENKLILKKAVGVVERVTQDTMLEQFSQHSGDSVIKINVEMQTILHPIESHIDKNYDWNVWSIRKKAFDLYRITQCATHSCQTELSSHRKEVAVQAVMLSRNREVQTKTDSSTAAVKHQQYLAGLRGGPHAFNKIRFKQINLSSDSVETQTQ